MTKFLLVICDTESKLVCKMLWIMSIFNQHLFHQISCMPILIDWQSDKWYLTSFGILGFQIQNRIHKIKFFCKVRHMIKQMIIKSLNSPKFGNLYSHLFQSMLYVYLNSISNLLCMICLYLNQMKSTLEIPHHFRPMYRQCQVFSLPACLLPITM